MWYLQRKSDGKYITPSGKWTDDQKKAKVFNSVRQLRSQCHPHTSTLEYQHYKLTSDKWESSRRTNETRNPEQVAFWLSHASSTMDGYKGVKTEPSLHLYNFVEVPNVVHP
jgi:hypothetical protein